MMNTAALTMDNVLLVGVETDKIHDVADQQIDKHPEHRVEDVGFFPNQPSGTFSAGFPKQ
jgi:hypothetical protein